MKIWTPQNQSFYFLRQECYDFKELDGRGVIMPRQLNKNLFGDQPSAQPLNNKSPQSPDHMAQDLSYKINHQERKIQQLTQELQKIHLKIPQLEGLNKNLFEKNQANIKRLETAVKSNLQNILNKFSRLTSKVNERSIEQMKVQDLIARQNSVLQQYELRLNKMQKIITEQEMQLMNYKSTLKQLQKKHYL